MVVIPDHLTISGIKDNEFKGEVRKMPAWQLLAALSGTARRLRTSCTTTQGAPCRVRGSRGSNV